VNETGDREAGAAQTRPTRCTELALGDGRQPQGFGYELYGAAF